MKITLRDLEPAFAERMCRTMNRLFDPAISAADPEIATYRSTMNTTGDMWHAAATGLSVPTFLGVIGFLLVYGGMNANIPALAGGVAVAAGMRPYYQWWNKRSFERMFRPKTIPTVLRYTAVTAPEKAYAAVLITLLDEGNLLADHDRRALLEQMNGLLAHTYPLAAQQEAVTSALNRQNIPELEAERTRLQERIAAATDETARGALRQSLVFCEERLERAHQLAPLLERLEAQQEVIAQALLSVQGALGQSSLAMAGLAHQATPSVMGITETVARLRRQTEAVEQAVQEVIAIGAG
jgi:hypothetical protein